MKVIIRQVPKGVFSVIMGEFISKFTYWGTQSILVLMLISHFKLNQNTAFSLYGIATTFGFASSFIGGLLGDKSKNIVLIIKAGVVFSMLGSTLLVFSNLNTLFIGLSLLIFGAGLISPNLDNLIAELHYNQAQASQTGFTLLHGANNLGGLLAPVVFGLIGMRFNYHFCFFLSLILYATYFFFLHKDKTFKEFEVSLSNTRKGFLVWLATPLLISLSFFMEKIFNATLGVLLIYVVCVFANIVSQKRESAR